MENKEHLIYDVTADTIEQYDEKYNAILVSYFNNAFNNDVRSVSAEMNLSQEELEYIENHYGENNTKVKNKKNNWFVGDSCQAIYEEDLLPYEAIIQKIDGDIATVKFIGYNNVQKTNLRDLLPSAGQENVENQIRLAKEDEKFEASKSNSKKSRWAVGDTCQAVYEGNGFLYEALIEKINKNYATIKFIGYNSTQKTPVDKLYPCEARRNIELQNQGTRKGFKTGGFKNTSQKTRWVAGDSCQVKCETTGLPYEAVVQVVEGNYAYLKFAGNDYAQKVDLNKLLPIDRQLCTGFGVCTQRMDAKENTSEDSDIFESENEDGCGSDDTYSRTSEEVEHNSQNNRAPISETESAKVKNARQRRVHFEKSRSEHEEVPKLPESVPLVLTSPLMPPPPAGMLVEPKSETEALACMMSACYLSGYYAGYYNSMKTNSSTTRRKK